MQIQGLQKLTLLDYPGRTACTVFLSGCNFRCPFCHNAPLLTASDVKNILSTQVNQAQLPAGWVWADRDALRRQYAIPSAFSPFQDLVEEGLM